MSTEEQTTPQFYAATHAERNPDLPRNPERTSPRKPGLKKRKHSTSHDEDLELPKDKKHISLRRNVFKKDVTEARIEINSIIHRLKEKYDKPSFRIKQVVLGGMIKSRAVNSYNAKLHHAAKKLKLLNKPCKLENIRDHIKENPEEYNNLSESEISGMVNDLAAERELKQQGVRATTRAANLDIVAFVERANQRARDLKWRTGVESVILMSNGHPDDFGGTGIADSNECDQFWLDVFHMPKETVAHKFEAWVKAKQTGGIPTLNRDELRKVCGHLLQNGLEKITGICQKVEYGRYEAAILHKYGVHIVNCPDQLWEKPGVSLKHPSNPTLTKQHLQQLYDQLSTGRTRWAQLTRSELEKLPEKEKQQVLTQREKQSQATAKKDSGSQRRRVKELLHPAIAPLRRQPARSTRCNKEPLFLSSSDSEEEDKAWEEWDGLD